MAYSKGTPSVFVICSPFQALCAIAAIRQFEICDYLLFVRLRKGEVRNEQTISILTQHGIKYQSFGWISSKTISFWRFVIKALMHHHNKYKRLFIGDFRDLYFLYVGCGYVSDRAHIIYLDDGLATVSLLKGKYKMEIGGHHKKILRILSKRRHFTLMKNILTIYDGIKNNNYNVAKLVLNKVIGDEKKSESLKKSNIYILGTVVDHFCEPHQITEDDFINLVERLISQIKKHSSNEAVYFIPHGRETKKYAEQICESYGVVFHRPDKNVELMLIGTDIYPKKIYGFSSAALFTLKKIYPNTDVININIEVSKDNPYYEEFVEINNYYKENGIIQVDVK